jgi:large subunit ribosomal protein L4
MPAKAKRVALRSAIAGKLQDAELVVADLKGFSQPSSKAARKVLADLGAPRRAVIVVAERDDNLWKSFRNFPDVAVRTADELCAFDVVAGGLVIAESAAMDLLVARVGQQDEAQAAGGDA